MAIRWWRRADALTAAGANLKNIQLLGTGLWDNPRVFASPTLQGGLYAAPDPSGFRSFSSRYRENSTPIRCEPRHWPMTRSRWSRPWRERRAGSASQSDVLLNPSGFAGIDGLFRFRADGTNERGLAVMRVGAERRQPVAGSPKSFGA